MPARNAEKWAQPPAGLTPPEWVDSRIYSDQAIFEEELDKIWKKSWIPVCHCSPPLAET